MKQAFQWRLWFLSVLTLFLVACKPFASFDVSPHEVKVGVEATFDASASSAASKPRGNAVMSYSWDFGDGTTGTGKVAKHTYTQEGNYLVKLQVTDKAGRTSHSSRTVKVVKGEPITKTTSVKVLAQIAGGVVLPGVEVRIGSSSDISGVDGVAELTDVPVGDDRVIRASKPGYVAQAVQTVVAADTDDQQVLIVLLPEKDTLNITAIEAEQTLRSNYLNASVTLPANAMVTTTGAPATGAATLKLTPWDISGIDLQAMPGNGSALDADGSLVDLISAGMMSVEFSDAAGNKLQVAQGKSAVIQMDLPAGTTNIGGNPVAEGTSIPLWNFDEDRGLWIREGTGTVVATATGLAVTATVSHFSIWNWDYVTARPIVGSGSSGGTIPPGATTLTLSCLDPDGTLTACAVQATITYPGGGGLRSWAVNLTAAETTISNIPGDPTIVWRATTVDGLLGTATSGTTGRVVIQLATPNVDNFVRCFAPDGSGAACQVTRTTTLADGSANILTSYVPAEGATIRSQLDTAGPLSWTASTGFAANANSTWTRYNGTAISTLTGDVNINLVPEVVSTGKTIRVSCSPTTGGSFFEPIPLSSCSIQVLVYDADGSYVDTINVPSGLNGPVSVNLPGLGDGAQIQINATGESNQPVLGNGINGFFSSPLGDLQENQLIEIILEVRIFLT